jgi:hypothetical protein
MVEGTIEQMLGRRLKQTGARRKTGHVAPFVGLVALDGSPEWGSYWSTPRVPTSNGAHMIHGFSYSTIVFRSASS